ncbi:ATP-binding protein [bacterium]|nr:MAG: ATP-binding protein [bacterium]RKZ13159.1 MAG: ATP-binding protein [bacterium]
MDPRKNPYAPGAGTKPPELVGRDEQIESFDVLLERLENGYAEQSMIITGLRGVGKTVLLDVFREKAEEREWATIEWEVDKSTPFGAKISSHVRRALLQLAPKARWTERARKAASILKSFTITFNPDGAVTAGLDVEALEGSGDSGAIAEDLSDLFVALGEAAQEQRTGVIFLLDEIQYLKSDELEALIAALHKSARRSLPITLVGAGLPQIPRLAGEAKSYSERLFRFPRIGELDPETDARDALVLPARNRKIEFKPDAIDFVVDYTQGYPYFLQEYGKILWDEASESPITRRDAAEVLPIVEARLDEGFFRVRAERTTELELKYLYAMAMLGPAAHRASEVAQQIDRTTEQAGPIRSRLIDKGLLYTPGHGLAAFTVPQFDRYMLRAHATLGGNAQE